jgi:hypothetical protein
MTPNPLTTGQQTLTAAGAVTPSTGLDISALAGDYMLEVEVQDLHSASGTPAARVVIEDSVNAFTAALPVAEFSFSGKITTPVKVSVTNRTAPGARLGTGSAVIRANVVKLDGGTPSITLTAALHN